MRNPVLVLTCLLVLSGLGLADDPLVVRTYDIGALTSALAHEPGEVLGLPVARDGPFWPEEAEPESFLTRDQVVEMVKAGAEPTAWFEIEGASIDARDDGLQVRAPERVQAHVARVLSDLWAEASRRVTLEAQWLEVGPEAAAALASSGAMDRLAKGRVDAATVASLRERASGAGSRASSASAIVRPGAWACLGQADVVSYVADYGVEIAQGSRVGDPIVGRARDGWSLQTRAFALQDGGVWVEALAQRSEIERPIRTVDLEAEPFGSVDLPASRIVRFTTAARLAAGETWASLARSPEHPDVVHVFLLTARVTGEGARSADPRRYDLGPLARAPLEIAVREDGGRAPPLPVWLDGASPPSADEWIERLRMEVDSEEWSREGSWLTATGSALYARAEAGVLDRAQAWLGRREASALRTVRLHVRLQSAAAGTTWREAGGVSVDLPLGRAAMFEVGVERAYVADWDVEVAQEARSGDPIVGTAFGGLWMNARATAAPRPDALLLNLQGAFHALAPTFEMRRPRNEVTGIVEMPRVAVAHEGRDLVLEVGKPLVLEVGGTPERRLRIEVRAER